MSSKAEYVKPQLEYWSATELDAIQAQMSGGGGGGYNPPAVSYRVHILFSPIVVSLPVIGDLKLPFDHAAMFISFSGTDYGYFYSFAANPEDGLGIITGTPGYLSTSCSVAGNHPQQEILYSSITASGTVYTDKKPTQQSIVRYGNDTGYYRSINFTITNGSQIWLKNTAEAHRNQNAGILNNPEEYKLLWSNCYDKVAEILSENMITIEYNWANTVLFITAAVGAIALVSPLLAAAIDVSLAVGTISAGHLNIPNMVYDGFTAVKRQGFQLSAPSGSQYRTEFKAR